MPTILTKITNLYLYSSIHIGICCVLLFLYTTTRFRLDSSPRYAAFLFCSTVFIYSIHRIIGMKKVEQFADQGRFAVIRDYRSHILVYTLISGIACIYIFWHFSMTVQMYLTIAAVISILYTLPVFGKRRRLRDFAFVKIFLIAIVWAFVTETIPMLSARLFPSLIMLAFAERFFFFIGITIPFDIRDRSVDQANNVATIATSMSDQMALYLAIGCILLAISFSGLMFIAGFVGIYVWVGSLLAYTLTIFILWWIRHKKEDYLYTGLLDGTIMLPYICLQLVLFCTT